MQMLMKQTFTLNQLFLLACNENEKEFFSGMRFMFAAKHIESTSPSESVIKNILNYSRGLSILKTKFTGNVKLILN